MRSTGRRAYGDLVLPRREWRRIDCTKPTSCGPVQYSVVTIERVMPEPDPRIRTADHNFVAAFDKLVDIHPGSELRRFGAAVAWDCRIPSRIFNGVAVLETAETDDVATAVAWIRDRDIPHSVWVREDLVASVDAPLTDAGLAPIDGSPEPVMGLRPPEAVAEPPAGVSVREVVDAAMLEEHTLSVIENGFAEVSARLLYAQAFVDDPDVRLFTAYLDGRAAGHSAAIRTGDVSGVYAVGVPEEFRRRGIGAAVTWAAVQAGREWGCELVVLQSSPMGFGVYRRMGFEVLTHYAIYR
jgi:GNAT superfamily N-acetyltransferase